jgi:RNA polymerase sigma-32 factor
MRMHRSEQGAADVHGEAMMTTTSALMLSPHVSLSRYLQEIRKFPMLSAEYEFMLAKRWREHGDVEAAHKLVTSHLRLVVKLAMRYRGYGLPLADLIAECNVGVMQAVKGFDPDRGFRLSTYALWWIRAAIQEYVLRSWSLVKVATTPAQRKLFFGLRRAKSRVSALGQGDLSPENITSIARALRVSEHDVAEMNRRLAGPDRSLNAPMRVEGEGEWQEWLVDEGSNQEERLAEEEELNARRVALSKAMQHLSDRERHILTMRRLKDEPPKLEELATKYGISPERVRQIEVRAFEKLQAAMRPLAASAA